MPSPLPRGPFGVLDLGVPHRHRFRRLRLEPKGLFGVQLCPLWPPLPEMTCSILDLLHPGSAPGAHVTPPSRDLVGQNPEPGLEHPAGGVQQGHLWPRAVLGHPGWAGVTCTVKETQLLSGTAWDFFPEIVAGFMEWDPEEEPGTRQQLSAGPGEGVEGVRGAGAAPLPPAAPQVGRHPQEGPCSWPRRSEAGGTHKVGVFLAVCVCFPDRLQPHPRVGAAVPNPSRQHTPAVSVDFRNNIFKTQSLLHLLCVCL